MAFQMKDMNKGYYNLTPLASSEMVCWNKERTAERVAGALDEYVYRTRARAADSCMYVWTAQARPTSCLPPVTFVTSVLVLAAVRAALPAPGTAPLWHRNPGVHARRPTSRGGHALSTPPPPAS